MKRRTMLALCAALLVLPLSAVRAAPTTPKKPNIVFFLCDDLGYAEIGCYGQKLIKTPNVDHLATEGMRFTQFYSGSPVCGPSRCTLLTGLHTGHTVVRDNKELKPEGQYPLTPNTYTLGRMLQDSGYTTACVGKWGLGGPDSTGVPEKQGFDHFFGHLCQRVAHNHYTNHLWRDGVRVDLEGNTEGNLVGKQFAPDLMADDAIHWLHEQHEKRPDKPFFLYFATPLPHVSLQVPEDSMAPYRGQLPDKPFVRTKGDYVDQATPHAAYAGMVSRLDSYLGRVLATLKELNLEDDTIVIFTSDNGPTIKVGGADSEFFHSAGPLRGLKQDTYEGGIRIPFIARWPGHIKADSTSDQVGAFWDFMPTFAEILGLPAPQKIDGLSIAPTLLGRGEQRQHDYLYWEYHSQGDSQAIRMRDWKAVRNHVRGHFNDAPIELYDLATDVGERHDVARDHPDVVGHMRQLFTDARTPAANPDWNFQPQANAAKN